MQELELCLGYDAKEEILKLFTEYTDMLISENPKFAEYLTIQNYDAEIADLRSKYGEPEGRLYIARLGDAAVGCIAMKNHDGENSGELKRLYIRPEFRGRGYSKIMVEKILNDAKQIGYDAVYLDTLPNLKTAKKLYESMGFCRCEPFNDDPMGCQIFMCRRLDDD